MECVDTIRAALRSRMDFYKIPYDEDASGEAITFNRTAAIETIEEEKDVYRVDWVKGDSEDQVFIGHKVCIATSLLIRLRPTSLREVFRIADPAKSGYQIRWPFYGNHFNTRHYESLQVVLNDVQVMWETMIAQELRIDRKTFKVSPLDSPAALRLTR
jgi:actin-related protein 8